MYIAVMNVWAWPIKSDKNLGWTLDRNQNLTFKFWLPVKYVNIAASEKNSESYN